MSQALVSLGNWRGNVYQSAVANIAPGVGAGFSAFCAIRGASDTSLGQQAVYFGNTDGVTTGWSFRRLTNLPADPLLGNPAFARLAFVVASDAPAEVSIVVHIPLPLFISRVFFLGCTFRGNGNDMSFYINGTRMADPVAFADNIVLGDVGLQYGVSFVASLDQIIGAGYSTETFGEDQDDIDSIQEAVFQRFVRVEGGAVMREALNYAFVDFFEVPLPQYIYDSWSNRGPFLATPSTLLSSGSSNDGTLTYGGGAQLLTVEVDTNPNITGSTAIPIVAP